MNVDSSKPIPFEDKVAESLRTMPEQSVPSGFSARVMAGLDPKRPSLATRLRLWLTRPRSVTFTPARAIPALAVAVVVLMAGLWSVDTPTREPASPSSVVRFVLGDADHAAHSVAVIGSFNEWRPKDSTMRYDPEAGAWVLETRLPPGDHEYVFLVDGRQLVADPRAQVTRDDGFGNMNSIVFVDGDHEQML